MSETLHITIIEDQHLFRESMITALSSRIPKITFSTYSDVDSALANLAAIAKAQVALVDVRLGRETAFDLVNSIRDRAPGVRMIWMTSIEEDYLTHRANEAGLPGFVHKHDNLDVLVTAVQVVAAGGRYYSETVQRLLKHQKSQSDHFTLILSDREQEVLRHIGAGFSNHETAALMGLSAWTIQAHRRNIMARLGLHSATELVTYALKHGFVDPQTLKKPRGT